MDTKNVTQLIDAMSARAHFGEVMKRVDRENVRFLVSLRGKPKAVIMSVEDYLRNIVKQPELITKIQMNAGRAGLDRMSDAEIEGEIAAFRKAKRRAAANAKGSR